MTRKEAYKLVDGERAYQDSLGPDRTLSCGIAGGTHTVGEHLTLLNAYVAKANQAWSDNPGDTAALDVIRKIAGIAVRCLEQHGAPPRIMPSSK